MTKVKFLADEKGIYGFEISGHCSVNGDDEVGKTVCAAVSSAAYMTVNTVTDVIGDKAEVTVDDAVMKFYAKSPCECTKKLLEGLKLHLSGLADQYKDNISVNGGAKNVKD